MTSSLYFPPLPHLPSSVSSLSPNLPFPSSLHLYNPRNNHHHLRNNRHHIPSSSATPPPEASSLELPLFLGHDGVYSIHRPTSASSRRNLPSDRVVLLWDLDNKPPRGPPFDAALSLHRLASSFGTLLHASAFANRHAFQHLPGWVLQDRRDRRHRDHLESLHPPSDSYSCSLCGRRFPTHIALRRHFRSLHERERNKKLSRLSSLKGKKRRERFREKYISGNTRYEEAARDLGPRPRQGYGLAREIRRAGVSVRTVKDRPQAADAAMSEEMERWMAKGVEWLFLVSDDSDFTAAVRQARESETTKTVVVGDWRGSLGRYADVWVPWAAVESGEVGAEVVRAGGWKRGYETGGIADDGDGYSGEIEVGTELDEAIEELVRRRPDYGRREFRSAFSDEEGEEEILGGHLDNDDESCGSDADNDEL